MPSLDFYAISHFKRGLNILLWKDIASPDFTDRTPKIENHPLHDLLSREITVKSPKALNLHHAHHSKFFEDPDTEERSYDFKC